MTLSPVLSKKIELEAEQLMWDPALLEVNEELACHINSSHLLILVDHRTQDGLK